MLVQRRCDDANGDHLGHDQPVSDQHVDIDLIDDKFNDLDQHHHHERRA
jgi:hypothetical protein